MNETPQEKLKRLALEQEAAIIRLPEAKHRLAQIQRQQAQQNQG